ncbi:MAG TPA: glycosyltransferase family 39 protein, partial [Gemmatimonadaceae bacterium]|nr:glycosyltransferase family 39 protein [Gemmatimonadaceae bacterium]
TARGITALATYPVAPRVHALVADRAFVYAMLILGGAGLVRLALAAVVPVVPDESYYWEFSRRLATGYFDHPPAIALLVRAGVALFGVTALGVRFWPVVAGWIASVLLVLLARRLGGDRVALRTAVIIACVPLAAAGLVIATPSTPLMLAAAGVLYALDRAIEERVGSRASLVWWLVAGGALGLALLANYEGALLALGVLVALIAFAPLRRQLATPAPYLAALVALVLFAPNIWWNARHDWIAYRFQFVHGFGGLHHPGLAHLWSFLGGELAVASPILFVLGAIAVSRALRHGTPRERLLGTITATSMVVLLVSALRGPVEVNWTATAYLPAIALVALWRGGRAWRRWLVAGCGLGAALVLVTYAQALAPVLPIKPADDPTARGTGWAELAQRVERTAAALRADPAPREGTSEGMREGTREGTRDSMRDGTGDAALGSVQHTVWIAGNRYQEASELAFHLPSHPLTFSLNLGSRPNQYHLWPLLQQSLKPGDDLVLVLPAVPSGAGQPVIELLRPHFSSVQRTDTVALTRGQQVREREEVWVLRGAAR